MTSSGAHADGTAVAASGGPRYYLGMRRGWWVLLCVALLCAVDAVPLVGPYLALAVLLWMVAGLARAEQRSEAPAPVAAPAPVHTAVSRRSSDSMSALSS